jgi:16S rRNA (guanine527-N7)-methyltransferase
MTNQKSLVLNKIKEFCQLSQEQENSLQNYVDALIKHNNKFNLIGKSTIENIWERHILDCAQIFPLIQHKNKKTADFGSGAGLPGIILSILGIKEINLIEKSFRKAEFLRIAKDFSPNKIYIHQRNIEEIIDLKFSCITSRAFAPLPMLLQHSQKFLEKDGYCLFLKGRNLKNEIVNSKFLFNFDYELFPSLTSKESHIIKIFNLNKKN